MAGESSASDYPEIDPNALGQEVWRFGGVELDLRKAELNRDGQVLPVTPLLLAVLSYLVRHHDHIVTRDELISAVWKGVAVGEGSLRQAIWELRQKLGESAVGQSIIQTVRGRGYRFVAPVEVVSAARHDSELSPRAQVWSAASEPLSLPAQGLFGRDAELSRLHLLLHEALHGGGRACAIVGSPGVGKSRLARELSYALKPRAQSFTEGHADPNRSAPPFWPWLQMLTGYLHASPSSRPRYAELAPSVFRLLKGTAAVHEAQHPESLLQHNRFSLLAEMGRLFVALAHDAPGLLLFEDLQWADEGSLAFLRHLLPMLARTRSLLVVTCRALRPRDDRAVAGVLRELTRTVWSEQIELHNLTASDVAQMLAAHAGGEVPENSHNQVFEISRGNPLFANELARLLAKSSPSPASQMPLGMSEIKAVIKRRLEVLPDDALIAVRAASVLSADFTLAELAGLLGERAAGALSRVDACFEQEVFADGPGSRFSFAHPLLREAAYELLSREERCRLHRRAGEWLEAQGADTQITRRSELARHFVAAAPDDCTSKAVQYATDCAAFAYASTAYADCVFYYQQALSCAELDPLIGPAAHLELELLQGEAQRAAGMELTRVNDHFLRLAQRAEALQHPALFARAVLGYAGQRHIRYTPTRFPAGSHLDQVLLLEKALAGLGTVPSELRALLLCSLGAALFYTTERARREAAIEEALQIARTLGIPWLQARVLATRVYCCAAPDAREARLSDSDALVQLAREHMLAPQEVDALITRAVLRLGTGSSSEADEDMARARYLTDTMHLPLVGERCALLELMRAFWTGDLPRARLLTEQLLSASPEDAVERAFFLVRMTTLNTLANGLQPQTLALHENWLAEHPNVVGIHAVLATVYATLGQAEVAQRHFDSAARDDFRCLPEDITWISEMTSLADAAKRLNDRERAAAVFKRLVPYGHVFDFFGGEAAPGGPVAYWLAELALTLGDYQQTEAWLEVAEDLNVRLGATLFQQFANVCWARLILRSRPGHEHEAQTLLGNASNFAARTGVTLLRIAVQDAEREFVCSENEGASNLS